jgi:hypothetical protein
MGIELGSVLQALCYSLIMNWGLVWKHYVILRSRIVIETLLYSMIKILKLYVP